MVQQKRPGRYHHGDLDRALIEAAVELTKEHGIDGWGLAQAARRLGVSSGAPYKHFANKRELLDAVAIEGQRAVRDVIVAAVKAHEEPRAQALALARGYMRLACRQPTLYSLTFSDARPTTLQMLRDAGNDTAFGALRDAVASWSARDLIYSDDHITTTIMIWAHAHGLASLVTGGKIAMSERKATALADRMMVALLDGITSSSWAS